MKKIIGISIIIAILLSAMALSGCTSLEGQQHDFFCGAIHMTFIPKTAYDGDDEIQVTFFKPGNYTIVFEPNPFGYNSHSDQCCNCNGGYVFNITEKSSCCDNYEFSFFTWKLPSINVCVNLNGDCEQYYFNG